MPTKPVTEDRILHDEIVPARAPWSRIIHAGETLRIIDLDGNQAVDCLLYNPYTRTERYSAPDTIAAQRNIFLGEGTQLLSNEGNVMMRITADDVGFHDTIAGACSRESNSLRYGHHTRQQHACVENFLIDHAQRDQGKRDMTSNINWFMYVPVDSDGTLGIVDGRSAPGKAIDLLAVMDTRVVVSNCPQINNPCNGFDPTPVRMVIYR
jgi:hypothetical protein